MSDLRALLIIGCMIALSACGGRSSLQRDTVQRIDQRPQSNDEASTFDYQHQLDPSTQTPADDTQKPFKVFIYTRPAAVEAIREIVPQRNRQRTTTVNSTTTVDGVTSSVEVSNDNDTDSSVVIVVDEKRSKDDIVNDQNFIVNRDDMIQVAINQLVNTQTFTVLNRQQLAVMEQELRRQHGANTDFDQEHIIEYTRLLGADHLITITPISNTDATTSAEQPYAMVMALTSLASGEVIASQQGTGAGVYNAIDNAAIQLAEFVEVHRDRLLPATELPTPRRLDQP